MVFQLGGTFLYFREVFLYSPRYGTQQNYVKSMNGY